MRYDYQTERKEKVTVKGIPCELLYDRLDLKTIPEGMHYYEIGGDDEIGDTPCRIKHGIAVNFYASLVSEHELPLGEDGALWLEDGDLRY